MLADPLTKSMDGSRMVDTMMTGRFDMRPTEESLWIKEKNRASRKAGKMKEQQEFSTKEAIDRLSKEMKRGG